MSFIIKEPYWKYRAFGISDHHFAQSESITIECAYKDKKGNYVYPHIYRMNKTVAQKYQTQRMKGNVLRIIPVSHFEVDKYRQPDHKELKSE